MSWNHRVIKHPCGYCEIVEMYYDANGKPEMWGKATVGFEGDDDPLKQIGWLKKALEKPFIDVDDDGLLL